MPNNSMILVLAVREPALRSALAARLSALDVQLITARDIHDPAIGRIGRPVTALLVDEPMIGDRSDEWLASVLDDPCWRRVIVLTSGSSEKSYADARLIYLDRAAAASAIAALVPDWRGEGAG